MSGQEGRDRLETVVEYGGDTRNGDTLAGMLSEVAVLQKQWSSLNSPAMERRGLLVRRHIPSWLNGHHALIAQYAGPTLADFNVQGRDGTGPKAKVPWVRFFSPRHSPTPQTGWYCVWLFHAQGAGAYLCLGHGSTVWTQGEFVPRRPEDLAALVAWARGILLPHLEELDNISMVVDLGDTGKLGKAYSQSMALARWYPATSTASENDLLAHTQEFARLLGILYDAQDLGRSLHPSSPAIQEAQIAVERIARGQAPTSRAGQGFGLSAVERSAVERRAMTVAEAKLKASGFTVKDTSATQSYDFVAERNGLTYIVEVKGTTSGPTHILLTANEVEQHRAFHPNNILIVVHSIELARSREHPRATGGQLIEFNPWMVAQERLRALSYAYSLNEE